MEETKITVIDDLVIRDTENSRIARSDNYNFLFSKKDGVFVRWGKDMDDDPVCSPYGPEIADIEISTICNSKKCKFCYKNNTSSGKNMSLETFKIILSKLPRTTTQIAFGIGDIDGNPDLWKIMEHCRDNDVVPNITINGSRMNAERYDLLARFCGAVAVSRYLPVDDCYNSIKELTDRGMKQVNIHQLISRESYEECFRVIDDRCGDPRLKDMNAIVFLSLKERGRAVGRMHSLRDTEKYKALIDYAIETKTPIGFDSCSAPLFLKAVEDRVNYNELLSLAESCESTLFSIYIDVDGNAWPCSFLSEDEYQPVYVPGVKDFSEVWNSDGFNKFRADLLNTTKNSSCLVAGCRECPKYKLYRKE